MTIHVTTAGVPNRKKLREHVERRVHFALGQFGRRISRVRVRVVDVNGPRGGVDMHCTMHVELPRLPSVVVEEKSHEAHAAIDGAADRVGRAVARRIARAVGRRRERLDPEAFVTGKELSLPI